MQFKKNNQNINSCNFFFKKKKTEVTNTCNQESKY